MKSANTLHSILERQHCAELKSSDSVARLLGDKSWLCSPLTMWLEASYLTSLSPSFLFEKWGYQPYRVLGNICKALGHCLAQSEVHGFKQRCHPASNNWTFHSSGSILGSSNVSHTFLTFNECHIIEKICYCQRSLGEKLCRELCDLQPPVWSWWQIFISHSRFLST